MISTLLRTLCFVLIAAPTFAGESIFKDVSVYDALAEARLAKQVVLVSWTRPDDPDCKRMERTWEETEIIDWINKNAVAVQIDGDKERRQAKNWSVKSYPTVLLLQPDGTILLSIVGFQPMEEVLVELDAATRAARAGVDTSIQRPLDETANDPEAWLSYANAIFAKGETDATDCLNAYLWCLDNGDIQSPGFLDRYLQLILRRIIALEDFAPAKDELRRRSNQYARALKGGFGTPSSLRILISIGNHLGEPGEGIKAFESILASENRNQEMMDVALDGVLETLVGRKRYKDILDAAGDTVARAKLDSQAMTEESARETTASASTAVRDARRDYVDRNGAYYEALLAIGRGADAKALAEVVLDYVPTGNAYATFINHAKRAEQPKVAAQICERGLQSVASEKGKKMMVRARDAKKIGLKRAPAGGRTQETQTKDD